MLSPAEASIRGRIGAYTLHATHNSREITAKARARFLQRFEEQVDPERRLPEQERLRRAEHARKAHFQKLALASARKRAKRAKKPGSLARSPSELTDSLS